MHETPEFPKPDETWLSVWDLVVGSKAPIPNGDKPPPQCRECKRRVNYVGASGLDGRRWCYSGSHVSNGYQKLFDMPPLTFCLRCTQDLSLRGEALWRMLETEFSQPDSIAVAWPAWGAHGCWVPNHARVIPGMDGLRHRMGLEYLPIQPWERRIRALYDKRLREAQP